MKLQIELTETAQEAVVESARELITTAVKTFDRHGVFINSIRVHRDEQTGELDSINFIYETKTL